MWIKIMWHLQISKFLRVFVSEVLAHKNMCVLEEFPNKLEKNFQQELPDIGGCIIETDNKGGVISGIN